MESTGFSIVYRSLTDLVEDHRGHVSQGRMIVAWTEPSPAVGTRTELRLSVPGGARFELSGAVSRVADGRGFAVDLSPESRAVAHELEQLVASHAFQQALRVESPSSRNSRFVSRWESAPASRIGAATTASGRLPGAARPSADATQAESRTQADSRTQAADLTAAEVPRPASSRIPGAPTVSGRLPEAARATPNPPRTAPPPPATTASGRPPAAAPSVAAVAPVAARPETDDLALDDDDSGDEQLDRYDDYDDEELYGEEDPEIAATTSSDTDDEQPPINFRTPNPGEKYAVYILKVKTVLDLVDMIPDFRATAKLVVPSAADPAQEGDLAQLRVSMPGRNIFTLWALVGRVTPDDVLLNVNPDSASFGKLLAFPKSVLGSRRMATEKPHERGPNVVIRLEEERPREDENDMPVRRRITRMSMEDKINMALSGTREERMALAMDGNKAIHHYLLKNARISLDEIAFIARLPTMNPDVLGKIAENPSYTQNLSVVKNLVYNPKTPVPLAIRLLDRMPRSEVLNLSKRMSMNARLVQAAKKKIEGPTR